MQLLAGFNIPFLVALGLCVALSLFQVVSGFGDHAADVDGADADGNADGDADAEADGQSGHGGLPGALGVGKIPLMLVLIGYLGAFGAIGLVANTLIGAAAYPSWGLPAVTVASLIGAAPATRWIAGALARLAPRSSTAIRSEQLVGRAGVVVSASISASYGRVAVRDEHGSVHTVFAVVAGGAPLPERAEVALVSYDPSQRRFTVVALDQARRRR